MADVSLYLSDLDFPTRRAAALAAIEVDLTCGTGHFHPWSRPAFAAEEIAACHHDLDHDPPGSDCDCGFVAADRPEDLLDLLHPSLETLAGAALLQVDLGGFVVADGSWLRGGAQRVFEAGLLRWCRSCVREDQAVEHDWSLVVVADHGRLSVSCKEHLAHLSRPVVLSLTDVAELVRAEVSWASADEVETVRWHVEQRAAAPQLVGPLAMGRRVSQLRMGQLGFVAPTAVRLDHDGVLWIDRDAPAPQRPNAAAIVPVKRSVGLGLELIAATPAVRRLDDTLARRLPPWLGVREEKVSVIRGLRHTPRLAAAVRR